jgi:GT2 family glycosyltransferase
MISLSIIIVSFNQRDLLANCLRSLQREGGFPTDWEILVVDNASADGSVEMLRQEFPTVTVIPNTTNAGFARANNQALRIARGGKLVLLNNDTVVKSDAMETMSAWLDTHPDTGVVGPKLLNADGSIQVQGSMIGPHFWNANTPVETSFLRGAVWMFPRKTMDQVGLLDEQFFFYNEDIDYCLRVKKAGFRLIYCPDAEVIHYGGKMDVKRHWMGFQSSLRLWKKYWFHSML